MLIVDLSSNNEAPDFHAFKAAGVGGVWIKATQGHDYVDPFYDEWMKEARAVGIRVGAYHYATSDTGSDPGAEAHWFCSHAGQPGRRDLRPVLDYEKLHKGGDDLEWIRAFNGFVKTTLGVGPLFYSFPALIEQLKLTRPVGYGLWLAEYGADDGQPHPYAVPAPWKSAVAHQYTSQGHVDSYGPVDLTQASRLLAILAHPVLGLV